VADRVPILGADLQAEVAVGDVRVEVIVREGGHRGQLGRPLAGKAEAAVEQRRADADRDRQVVRHDDRAEHTRVGRWRGDARVGWCAAAREEPSPVGERTEQLLEAGAVGRLDVEGQHRRMQLQRRRDAGLPYAVERYGRGRAHCHVGGRGRRAGDGDRDAGTGRGAGHTGNTGAECAAEE